ncbi:aldo/keto reductase [Candidatus Falkowbacteria bacterium]|nr:aldo/keto reductase [Candidatus Falkowbacteria bacterium]
MPVVGLGTWQAAPAEVGPAVRAALLEHGYRHLDCASVYHNEPEIGLALRDVFSRMKRQDVFITSKLWITAHQPDRVVAACKKTLHDLQLEYLDLYLMHWGLAAVERDGDDDPRGSDNRLLRESISLRQTWEAMQALTRLGLVRSVGVANFTSPMLIDLLSYAAIRPAVNQIELHPYLQQSRLVEFCQSENIAVTAYSPLGSPGSLTRADQPVVLQDPVISGIAAAHGKTPAQVLLRWAIQRQTIAIPKTIRPERLAANIAIFDFTLSATERSALAGLERRHRYVDPWEWWGIPYFD